VTVDVVVVAWRSRELVAACLERLERDGHPHRTIVVDNASGDGTAELVRERFPGITLLELERNDGFGRAVNAGAQVGDGEAIVLVNPDLRVEPGFLAALTAPLADARTGMVAGLTTIPESGLVDGFGIELDRTLAAYNRLRHRPPGEALDGLAGRSQRPPGEALDGPAAGTERPSREGIGRLAGMAGDAGERIGRLAGPSGGAAAYRRAAFDAAGGFDPRLFAYGEDVDLALRLRAAGWEAAGAPDARGEHLGGATVGVDSARQRELAGFARGYLLRRYGVLRSRAAPRALLLEAAVVLWGLLRHRTAVPLAARVRGWRAGAGERRPIPPGAVDESIGALEALRRLRTAR
jgi:GT2 family glycosyltransferase